MSVYDGFSVERNTGEHLHGGVADDDAMQFLYMTLCNYSHPLYSPPQRGRREQVHQFAHEEVHARPHQSDEL